MLPLSARSPAALVQIADRYRDWLTANPDASLADVCFTAGVGRSHFEHRAALVVNSTAAARSYSVRSPTIARHRAWYAENVLTGRGRRGCSPVRAASTSVWPEGYSTPSPCSRRRWPVRGGRR